MTLVLDNVLLVSGDVTNVDLCHVYLNLRIHTLYCPGKAEEIIDSVIDNRY